MVATSDELIQLTVDIRHPDCWTLQTTAAAGGGLLGHGMVGDATGAGNQFGVYTAYGESMATVDRLLAEIEATRLTDRVSTVSPDLAFSDQPIGRAARDVLVEFDPGPSIRAAFADRGFLHCGPSVHEGGEERRRFLAWADRRQLNDSLEQIEASYDADLEIIRVASAESGDGSGRDDTLTPRQREAFSLARDRGYYDYPRATTTRTLAAEMGISKTTFLEHLRKAEAKLLRTVDGS